MTKSITRNFKYIAIFIGLAALLSACSPKTSTSGAIKVTVTADTLDEVVMAAGDAQSNYRAESSPLFDKMLNSEDTAGLDEDSQEYKDIEATNEKYRKDYSEFEKNNISRGGLGYFDALYAYGKKNLDNKSGLEALLVAFDVSLLVPDQDHRKTQKVEKLLRKHFVNKPEYTYVVQMIAQGHVFSTEKEMLKPLHIVVKETTNRVVKNHARLGIAMTHFEIVDWADQGDGTVPSKEYAQAAIQLNAIIKDTKEDPVAMMLSDDIRILALYQKHAQKSYVDANGIDEVMTERRNNVPNLSGFANQYLEKIKIYTTGTYVLTETGTDFQGNAQHLEQYKGRVLLIDFWATWCSPCIAKMPHLAKLKEQYKDRPFEILGVSADDDVQDAIEFFEDHEDYQWDQWHAKPGEGLPSKWGISAFPTVLLVDHTGRMFAADPNDEELAIAVKKLVAAAEDAK